INLETSLEAAEAERQRSIILVVGVSFLLLSALLFFARKRYMNSLAYDPVTSLLNSKTAINKIRQVAAPSAGRTNALALFDLGNFRDVNRQVGASKSDVALQQIAKTLSQITRQRDILGRFAPEQFIVCLIDIEEDSAKSFFERIRYALENTAIGEQQSRQVSVRSSMSIYIASDTFDDLDEILDDMQFSLGLQTETA
ncbi:GGDEF domain-containing protein, partial [Aliiglaciecola sp.]|nr:GGDEF domain-containing protein [Aliiglaciecola sp.]